MNYKYNKIYLHLEDNFYKSKKTTSKICCIMLYGMIAIFEFAYKMIEDTSNTHIHPTMKNQKACLWRSH